MNIHEVLEQVPGRPPRKRRGRGNGSGLGGTAGRGHKGAKARSGWTTRYEYEGGQMPLSRRIPKRGFNNSIFARRYDVVNLNRLEKFFEDGDTVTLATLAEKAGFKSQYGRLKVLGTGDLSKKLIVVAERFSGTARGKIEASGGTCSNPGRPGGGQTQGK
jgi:large subunit ribosomal protein L15